jgi:hypothetical protein
MVASDGGNDGFRISDWPESCGSAPSMLHFRLPNDVVESYRIRRIDRDGSCAFVEIEGRAGLQISQASDGQGVVKQLFYPSRGLSGGIAYRTTTNELRLGTDGGRSQCE